MSEHRELADLLRKLRADRKLSQDQLAKRINVSKSLVSQFESGKSIPQPDTARALDQIYGTGDEVQKAAKDAREDQRPWLRSWRDHECRATVLRCWEPLLIPGLLQREPYMLALFAGVPSNRGRIDELVRTRLARQEAVFGREQPPMVTCIIGEYALRRGPRDVMKDQLGYLADVGDRHPVTVRVLPDDAAGLHIGLGGPLLLATMPDGRRVGYLDDQLRGRLATEIGDVSSLELTFDAISNLALSAAQSRDRILEIMHEQ